MQERMLRPIVIITALLISVTNAPAVEPQSVTSPAATAMPDTRIEPNQTWSGDLATAQMGTVALGRSAEGFALVTSLTDWQALWALYQPKAAVPSVDFTTHFVVCLRNTEFYNRMRLGMGLVQKGVLEPLAMETMSARPIEDQVAVTFASFPRQGITSVKFRQTTLPLTAP
jgi:hypothetical protein